MEKQLKQFLKFLEVDKKASNNRTNVFFLCDYVKKKVYRTIILQKNIKICIAKKYAYIFIQYIFADLGNFCRRILFSTLHPVIFLHETAVAVGFIIKINYFKIFIFVSIITVKIIFFNFFISKNIYKI